MPAAVPGACVSGMPGTSSMILTRCGIENGELSVPDQYQQYLIWIMQALLF